MMRDLTDDQRKAVEWAARTTGRPAGLSLGFDDRRQIAALAVLETRLDAGRAEDEQRAYLGQRARGAVLDALRTERRCGQLHGRVEGLQRVHEPDEGIELGPRALEQPERREELRRVAAAVDALPHARRTVAWRLAEGYSIKEIAEELRVSVSRVSQLRREVCEFIWEMTTCLD